MPLTAIIKYDIISLIKRSKFLTNMMNKLKSRLIPSALSLMLLPVAVVKATHIGGVVHTTAVPTTIDVPKIINTTMDWAFGLLIALAAAFILYAAYLYLTGGGNEENVGKAKNIIIYAVVAIIVAFVSRGLVSIVQGLLTP